MNDQIKFSNEIRASLINHVKLTKPHVEPRWDLPKTIIRYRPCNQGKEEGKDQVFIYSEA